MSKAVEKITTLAAFKSYFAAPIPPAPPCTVVVEGLDLSPEDLSNYILSNVRFVNCALRKVVFRGANLNDVEFTQCDMDGADFKKATARNLAFRSCSLNRSNFGMNASFIVFEFCQFDQAEFDYARLEKIDVYDCDLSRARLFRMRIAGGRFLRTHGLQQMLYRHTPRCSRPTDDEIFEPPLDWIDRNLNWERLRFMSALPIFGLSYTVLLSAPLVMYLIATYNRFIDAANVAIEQVPNGEPEASTVIAALGRLERLPAPSLSFWLFLGAILLAVASTLYRLLCPQRIQHYSIQQWQDEIKGSPLHYHPPSWSRKEVRLSIAILMAIGALLTGFVSTVKIVDTFIFIWQNGGVF